MEKLYEIGISPDKRYLIANGFKCPYTIEIASAVATELVNLGKTLDVHGCLIDISGTESVSGVTDKYKFAYEKTRIFGLPRHWRYAFVNSPGDKSLSFIETVMQNAGFTFKVFENNSEAVDWLNGI